MYSIKKCGYAVNSSLLKENLLIHVQLLMNNILPCSRLKAKSGPSYYSEDGQVFLREYANNVSVAQKCFKITHSIQSVAIYSYKYIMATVVKTKLLAHVIITIKIFLPPGYSFPFNTIKLT